MSLRRRSLSHQMISLACSNLFLHLLGFAYRIALSRVAGSEGMGVYTLVMQVYSILHAVCLSGMCIAVSSLSSRFYERGDLAGIRRLTRIAVAAFCLLFAAMALPLGVFRRFVAGEILGDIRTERALLMLLLCIFLTGFENVFKSVFQGIRQIHYTIISEVGEQLLRTFLVLTFISRFYNGDHGYTAFLAILGMTFSELYSVGVLLFSYYKKFILRQGRAPAPQTGLRREFAAIMLPTAATSITANMFSSVATILFPARLMTAGFSRSASVSMLGVLSGMAAPVMMLPVPFINALCTVLLPNVSAAQTMGDTAALKRRVRKALIVTGIIAIPITCILFPFVPKLCGAIFGEEIHPTLSLLLALHTGITYFLAVSISILNGVGEQKRVFRYAVLGESLQLALIWFLAAVPQLNVYGYLFGMIAGDSVRLACNLRRVRLAVFQNRCYNVS